MGGSVPGVPSIGVLSPWFTAGVYTAVTWGFLAPTIPKLTFYVEETNYLYGIHLPTLNAVCDVPAVPATMSFCYQR